MKQKKKHENRNTAKQRAARGFSDRDAWNGGEHLAFVAEGLLRWYVAQGNAVPYRFVVAAQKLAGIKETGYTTLGDTAQVLEAAAAQRDREYLWIADVFHAYQTDWMDDEREKKAKVAFMWLADHFTELWD